MDKRRETLTNGLRQLTSLELMRILNTPDNEILTDGGNYDETTQRHCPLSVAFNLSTVLDMMNLPANNTLVSNLVGVVGQAKCGDKFTFNNLRGVKGSFYHGTHEERLLDLKLAITDVLRERAVFYG